MVSNQKKPISKYENNLVYFGPGIYRRKIKVNFLGAVQRRSQLSCFYKGYLYFFLNSDGDMPTFRLKYCPNVA